MSVFLWDSNCCCKLLSPLPSGADQLKSSTALHSGYCLGCLPLEIDLQLVFLSDGHTALDVRQSGQLATLRLRTIVFCWEAEKNACSLRGRSGSEEELAALGS